ALVGIGCRELAHARCGTAPGEPLRNLRRIVPLHNLVRLGERPDSWRRRRRHRDRNRNGKWSWSGYRGNARKLYGRLWERARRRVDNVGDLLKKARRRVTASNREGLGSKLRGGPRVPFLFAAVRELFGVSDLLIRQVGLRENRGDRLRELRRDVRV